MTPAQQILSDLVPYIVGFCITALTFAGLWLKMKIDALSKTQDDHSDKLAAHDVEITKNARAIVPISTTVVETNNPQPNSK